MASSASTVADEKQITFETGRIIQELARTIHSRLKNVKGTYTGYGRRKKLEQDLVAKLSAHPWLAHNDKKYSTDLEGGCGLCDDYHHYHKQDNNSVVVVDDDDTDDDDDSDSDDDDLDETDSDTDNDDNDVNDSSNKSTRQRTETSKKQQSLERKRRHHDGVDSSRGRSLLYCVCALKCDAHVVLAVFHANPSAATLIQGNDPDYPTVLAVLLSTDIGLLSPSLVGPIGEAFPRAYTLASRFSNQPPQPNIRCYTSEIILPSTSSSSSQQQQQQQQQRDPSSHSDDDDDDDGGGGGGDGVVRVPNNYNVPCPYPNLYKHLTKIVLFGRDPHNEKFMVILHWLLTLQDNIERVDFTFHSYADIHIEILNQQQQQHGTRRRNKKQLSAKLSFQQMHGIRALIRRHRHRHHTPLWSLLSDNELHITLQDEFFTPQNGEEGGNERLRDLLTNLPVPSLLTGLHIRGCNPYNPADVALVLNHVFASSQQEEEEGRGIQSLSWIHSRLRSGQGPSSQFAAERGLHNAATHLAHLTELNLSGCEFGDALIEPLVSLLSSSSSSFEGDNDDQQQQQQVTLCRLQKLDVRRNFMSQASLQRLLDEVGKSTTVEYLGCDEPSAPEAAVVLLHHLQTHNCTLRNIVVAGDGWGPQMQRIRFLCEVNSIGRASLWDYDNNSLSKEEYVNRLAHILLSNDPASFVPPQEDANARQVSWIYTLLRDNPALWV